MTCFGYQRGCTCAVCRVRFERERDAHRAEREAARVERLRAERASRRVAGERIEVDDLPRPEEL